MPKCLLIFCVLLLAVLQPVVGQQSWQVSLHYDVDQGMPASTVYTCYQDSKGFMWFGTSQGATRFDGKTFKTYTTKDGLPDNEVFKMFEDAYGRLWFVCYNTSPCFYKNDTVYNKNNAPFLNGFHEKDFGYSGVLADTGNTFLMVGGDNVYRVFKDTVISYGINFKNEGTFDITLYKNDYYLITAFALYKLRNNVFSEHAAIDSASLRGWRSQQNLFYYGHIISFKERILNREKKITFSPISDALNPEFSVAIDYKVFGFFPADSNTILLATDVGIKLLDLKTHTITSPAAFDNLDNLQISFLFKDKEGNLWASTLGDGVYMVTRYNITQYRPLNRKAGIKTLYVDDNGYIYVGRNDATLEVYGADTAYTIPLAKYIAQSSRILDIINYRKDYTILATDRGAVSIKNMPLKNMEIKTSWAYNAKCIATDGDSVYVGMSAGISCYNPVNNTDNFVRIDTLRVTAIDIDNKGNIWYGTLLGLEGHNFEPPFFGTYNTAIRNARINNIKHDKDDNMYIGTSNQGLYVYTANDTYRINDTTGLPSNICKNILIDEQQHAWVSTNKGLVQITYTKGNKQPFSFKLYDKKSGLPSEDISDAVVKGNRVWVSTPDGVFSFNSEKGSTLPPPPVYITSFSISDSVINFTQPIVTSYKNNNIQISFAGLSYANPQGMLYKYYLQGAGNDTVFTDLDRVNFSSLAAGRYIFYVWAQNTDGVWSTAPAQVALRVRPAFWQTWWFVIGVMLAVVLVVVIYFRGRITQLQKEQGLLRRIDELELMALKSQMNPHFVFNSLNSIQSFVNKNDARAANKYLSSFGRLIRQTLDFSSRQHISIEEEAEYLGTYLLLEKMRFTEKFDYFIDINESYPGIKHLEIPSLILQPYVENAIRHGLRYKENNEGILNINFYVKENILYCEVEDNGIGRVRAKELKSLRHVEYQSKGMELSGNRVDAINRLSSSGIQLNIIDKYDNGVATGTLIQLLIPLQATHDNSNNS